MITLKNLEQHTAQQVFEQSALHLLRQGKQSIITSGNYDECRYKDEKGLKCAFGCFISDEEYSSDFERTPIVEILGDSSSIHISLLADLQNIHDADSCPSKWPLQLTELGEAYELDVSFIKQFEVDSSETI